MRKVVSRKANCVQFLSAFAKLQKATISFVMSVCLSFRPRGTTRLPQEGFSLNLIFEYFFFKSVEKIRVSLQSDKTSRHFR